MYVDYFQPVRHIWSAIGEKVNENPQYFFTLTPYISIEPLKSAIFVLVMCRKRIHILLLCWSLRFRTCLHSERKATNTHTHPHNYRKITISSTWPHQKSYPFAHKLKVNRSHYAIIKLKICNSAIGNSFGFGLRQYCVDNGIISIERNDVAIWLHQE